MNTTLSTYKLVSPVRALLEENEAHASLMYGKSAVLQAEAWDAFNEAVDNNESNRVRNDLFENATFAEEIQHEAYKMWDAAKAMLLSIWN